MLHRHKAVAAAHLFWHRANAVLDAKRSVCAGPRAGAAVLQLRHHLRIHLILQRQYHLDTVVN